MTRVVLGDDVRLLLETERSFLRRENVEFVVADRAVEAAEKAASAPADLVILDARKTEEDAVAVCRAMKEDPRTRDRPVVVLVLPGDHDAAVAAGADAVVVKPLTVERLLGAIGGILALPSREVERIATTIKVEFRVGSVAGFGFTRDLGATGLFLKTREALSPGEEVELAFSLPTAGPHRIEAVGTVVRAVAAEAESKGQPPPGVGVRFVRISGEDRHLLARFVRDRAGAGP